MKLVYVYSQPRKNWEHRVRLGQMPDHVLYGLNRLRQFGHTISYADTAFQKFNLLKWIISPLQQALRRNLGTGFQLDQALLFLPKLRLADAIITTNDSCGLPIALLKRVGLLTTPQIYFHISFKPSRHNPWRWFVNQLLPTPEKVACFSKLEQHKLEAEWHLPKTRIEFIPLGVDTSFFKPKFTKPEFDLVAIGRDSGRDYRTLITAATKLKLKTLIICDPKNISGLSIPANVTIRHLQTYLQVRQAYRKAKIVVIPTRSGTVSGQISLLESLACGKPVIASKTAALRSSFSLGRQQACLFYKPGNANDLARAIMTLLHNQPLQKQLSLHAIQISRKLTSRQFSTGINRLLSILAVQSAPH